MNEEKINFSENVLGFACPKEIERQIVQEGKRLFESKSNIIRRALVYYFESKKNSLGGGRWYGNEWIKLY